MISYLAVVLFCTPNGSDCFFYNKPDTFNDLNKCKAFVQEVQVIIEKQYPVIGAQCLKVDAGKPV